MTYTRDIQIEFNHCDPFGIVFYPRYFEMTNSVVENFCADVLHYPFAQMILRDGYGVPTVNIDANFVAVSHLGETLRFTMDVLRVGRSSVRILITGTKDGETRLTVESTLVWVAKGGRPEAWPGHLRDRLMHCMVREPAQ